MTNCRRRVPFRVVVAMALAVWRWRASRCSRPQHSGASQSLGQLHDELGAQQARENDLASSISQLDASISSLESQITLVQNREAAVRQSLAADRARLAALQGQITRERDHLARSCAGRWPRPRASCAPSSSPSTSPRRPTSSR